MILGFPERKHGIIFSRRFSILKEKMINRKKMILKEKIILKQFPPGLFFQNKCFTKEFTKGRFVTKGTTKYILDRGGFQGIQAIYKAKIGARSAPKIFTVFRQYQSKIRRAKRAGNFFRMFMQNTKQISQIFQKSQSRCVPRSGNPQLRLKK